MSRVDEALRRAAGAPRLTVTTGMDAGVDRGRSSVALEDYPREDRRAASSPAPVAAAAAREDAWLDHVVVPRFSDDYKGKLVADPNVPRASIEQYRRLAATVHHLQAQHGLSRLMVSSALPREGKTLTAVNLAMTLSESYGRRVLLLDADLRRPSIHEVFGISSRHGLSEALTGERSRCRFSRVSRNLWVLPAGLSSTDPMATLASRQIEHFLDQLSQHFDWIVIDAPPFGVMADAQLLVRLTRAVVMVIAAGSTPYSLVEKTVKELGREHIVGVVLNRAEENLTPWSQYYGGDEDVIDSYSLEPTGPGEAPARGKKVDLLRS